MMALTLWSRVSAAGPPEDNPNQDDGQQVGLVSTTVECLAVKAGTLDSASATVRLEWEGQIEEAFLVLSAAGSEGGHSIYVNGQLVGGAPVRPGGQSCQAGSPATIFAPTDMIPIPIKVLAKGQNVVTLTNDANVNDGWTAANLHVEIHGVLSGPPVALLEATSPALSPPEIGAKAVVSDSVLLTSSYDDIEQLVWYQVPDGYTGSVSVPLLIGAHGMGGDGQWIRDFLAAEANNRTWLLAAPDMHGSHYINTGEYALAWPGAQHDIIDTIEYMMSEYEVDPSRIYITGGSMGGQTAAMMAAKYPDVFAAAAPWKPLTDLAVWHDELGDMGKFFMRTKIRDETDGTPSQVPFEYQRRSPIEMPQNSRLIPIKMWHDQLDVLVPIHHSYDLRDAINSWNPLTPVMVIDPSVGGCPPDQHCYNPAPADVFDYLESSTLSSQPPLSLAIRTDESKPYYWLNLAQTGGDHWSEVEAAYSLADKTVAATISDTNPLTVAFNLGSMPITGSAGLPQAGMGLSATTYQIKEGNKPPYLQDYTSGYLTVTLSTTGQFSLTISAIASDLHKIYLPIVMKE